MRNLEREIGSVCRKGGHHASPKEKKDVTVRSRRRGSRAIWAGPLISATRRSPCAPSIPGVATGLAWTPVGGDILFIEATSMPGSKGFQITGSIGNVMQESAHAALSYVRSKAENIGSGPGFLRQIRYPPAYPGRRTAQGRPFSRRDHGHRPGLADLRAAGPAGCRHDRRDHPARPGAAGRRDQGKGAGRASQRLEDGHLAPSATKPTWKTARRSAQSNEIYLRETVDEVLESGS